MTRTSLNKSLSETSKNRKKKYQNSDVRKMCSKNWLKAINNVSTKCVRRELGEHIRLVRSIVHAATNALSTRGREHSARRSSFSFVLILTAYVLSSKLRFEILSNLTRLFLTFNPHAAEFSKTYGKISIRILSPIFYSS